MVDFQFLQIVEAFVADHTTMAFWWQQAQPNPHFFLLVFG